MPTSLILSPTAEAGGSDQALARMLGPLAEAGFSCHVVVPREPPLRPSFEASRAEVHVIPMRRITRSGGRSWWVRYVLEWPLTVWRIVRLGRRVGAEVVSSNSLHMWYGWAAAAALRVPHLWHAREIVVQSGAALRLERFLVRHFSGLLVSCSRAVEQQFSPHVAECDRIVVHEDVDRNAWSPSQSGRFRRTMGLEPDVPVVGFAGRIDTWKGVDVLLEAWPTLLGRLPDAHLVVVGADVEGKEEYAAALRRRSQLLQNVHWYGAIEDVPGFMADIDVLAVPSTEPEPYGLVVVEALASGARVVVTAHGGPREILERAAEGAGVLVAPRDPRGLADALATQLSGSAVKRRPLVGALTDVGWGDVYLRALGPRRCRRVCEAIETPPGGALPD